MTRDAIRPLGGLAVLVMLCGPSLAGENLLRNGSFEGGKRYWHQVEDRQVVRGDAAHGEYALCSGPAVVARG